MLNQIKKYLTPQKPLHQTFNILHQTQKTLHQTFKILHQTQKNLTPNI